MYYFKKVFWLTLFEHHWPPFLPFSVVKIPRLLLFMRLIISLFLITLSFSLFAQPPKAKKKERSSSFSKAQRQEDLLLQEARQDMNKSPQTAIHKIEEALRISIRNKDKGRQAECYEVLGDLNSQVGSWPLASENYKKAEALAPSHRQKALLLKLGNAYERTPDLNNALETYKRLERVASSTEEKVNAKNGLGRVTLAQGKKDKALQYYEEVLDLEKQRNNKAGISTAKANISKIYAQKGQTEKAEGYYYSSDSLANQMDYEEEAMEIAEDEGLEFEPQAQQQALDEAVEEINANYRRQGRADKEIELRNHVVKNSEQKAQAQPSVSAQKKKIAEVYLSQGETKKAIKELEESVQIADSVGETNIKAEALGALSKAYKEDKDYSKALETYEQFVSEQEAIFQQREEALKQQTAVVTQQKDIASLEQEFEALQKAKDLQAEQLKNQKIVIYGLSLLLLILLIASYFIYKNVKARRIAHQKLALKSLRTQMNPHFIFNALNSVNHFIAKSDERSANRFIADFSRLMRLVLDQSQNDLISLSEEMEIINLYLKLEHNRFRDKFDYDLTIHPDIEADKIEVSPMLIQPFIENAVWHGLRYKEAEGKLWVKVDKMPDRIEVEITDNGIGRKKSQELKTSNQKKHNSIGLKNIENRLELINSLYDKKFSVKIEDVDEDGGTRVRLGIPV